MKVSKILSCLFIIFFMLGTTTLGYSTNSFEITVSDEYQETEVRGMVMFLKETGDNIIVQKINNQKIEGGKLSNYQLNLITEQITSEYKSTYNAEVEEIGKEEIIINEINVEKITYKITVPDDSENSKDLTFYQELNIFIGEDKLYDVIFTDVSGDAFSQEEKDSILNSFIMKEDTSSTDTESSDEDSQQITKVNAVCVVLTIIIVIAIIVIVIKKREKPKNDGISQKNKEIKKKEITEDKKQEEKKDKKEIINESEQNKKENNNESDS